MKAFFSGMALYVLLIRNICNTDNMFDSTVVTQSKYYTYCLLVFNFRIKLYTNNLITVIQWNVNNRIIVNMKVKITMAISEVKEVINILILHGEKLRYN